MFGFFLLSSVKIIANFYAKPVLKYTNHFHTCKTYEYKYAYVYTCIHIQNVGWYESVSPSLNGGTLKASEYYSYKQANT